MIDKVSYTLEWIKPLKARLGRRVDAKMLEKVIYALSLLEQLRLNGLELIFKGGTCLLLTSERPKRFSIDIDIITQHTAQEIAVVLEIITSSGIFTRWETDNERRTNQEAPVSHYKVYYKSQVDSSYGEEPILLDVLTGETPYSKVSHQAISHSWLSQNGDPVTVQIPSYECMLGDKLTAFAPMTTGILYAKGRPVEIIKQLHDLGFLFDNVSDLTLIEDTYGRIVKEELIYRKLEITYDEVLKDTFKACALLASRNESSKEFKELSTGIKNITNFIIDRFKIEEAITAAAKTAYICSLLRQKDLSKIDRFESTDQLKDVIINDPEFRWLNKLKKSNPEAFFYWEKALTK